MKLHQPTTKSNNNIIHSKICTFENNNCHSFRRDGDLSGRMSLIAYMKNG